MSELTPEEVDLRLGLMSRDQSSFSLSRTLLSFIHQSLVFQEQVMSTFADMQAKQATVDSEIQAVAADVQALLAKIASGGLSAADQASLDAEVAALTASTNALAGVDTAAKG